MASFEKIHWHEGLFLQPHHLQVWGRYFEQSLVSERRYSFSYPFGVVEAKLSPDALENHLIRFDRLKVVMPSGLTVSFPDNAELPPLDFKQAFAAGGSLTVSIAVPLWSANRANAVDGANKEDWRAKKIFRIAEVQQTDENTGDNAQVVLVRRINARLMLDGDDQTDLEVLPLLRISHAAGADVGLPRQDPSFIPACLVLDASATLRQMVRDLANQVEASRNALVIQMTRGGFSVDAMRGVQFEQMLRLRTLNRFGARLPHIVKAPAIAPFSVYLELRELLAELVSLHPERNESAIPDYDHMAPALCFADLNNRIRQYLRGSVKPTFIKVDFTREGTSLVAALTPEHLTAPNEYFLGIKTREDPRAVATLVEDADKFKLMPRSQETLRVRIRGLKLAEERHPPLELPAETGSNYFRINRSESARMWDRVKEEKTLCILFPEIATSDYAVTLYMTVPEEVAKP